MMIDRRLLTHFDWALMGLVLLIASVGMLNLYSTTSDGELSGTTFFSKQVVWMLIGLAVMITVAFVEYRFYSDVAYVIYVVTLFLLLAVMGYGYITAGAQRWIKIGSISFQPSEFIKIS